MKKKLNNSYFILRHGQTIHQTKKKPQIYKWPDKPPVKLTEKGVKQIKKVAKKLKKEKIDLIYSSDIYRTRQSAGIVAKELGLKVKFDKRLRDINLGIYRGGFKKDFYQDFPDPEERFSKKPPRGESWTMERDGIKVKTTFEISFKDTLNQIYTEKMTLEVNDKGEVKKFVQQKDLKFIFPQEFKLLIKMNRKFEFLGWWKGNCNTWHLDQPLEKVKSIEDNMVLLRRK